MQQFEYDKLYGDMNSGSQKYGDMNSGFSGFSGSQKYGDMNSGFSGSQKKQTAQDAQNMTRRKRLLGQGRKGRKGGKGGKGKPERKDPFHGSREFGHPGDPRQKRMIRNQQMNEYQMDPRRVAYEMNPNAQNMYMTHNEQMSRNPYRKMISTKNLQPSYYDQNNFSNLEPDRMFLAEAQGISQEYASVAEEQFKDKRQMSSEMYGYHMGQQAGTPNMVGTRSNEQHKQKRSYRDPREEISSNNKLWEHQFTPTIPY